VIWGGSGFDRQKLEVDGVSASVLVAWVLGRTVAATEEDLRLSLQERLGVAVDDAKHILHELIEATVLVEPESTELARARAEAWSRYGWDDAAAFHAATFGQRFDPDTLNELDYADYYRQLLADPGPVGAQPAATKPTDGYGVALSVPTTAMPPITVSDVLDRAAPINRFRQPQLSVSDLQGVLQRSVGVQRTVGGVLGDHLIKAHPSGGARHPCECYVIAKTVDGLPPATYHFDPVTHALRSLPDSGASGKIDQACFGKGGIVTASAVLVLTCRWLRHNWKYRYPRSYRMVLLELGHIIQTINLAAAAHGLGAYHCPSINDVEILGLLGLDDDCLEGPLYAIGIGAEGVR
jgi:SagB-type dehydrogenase family enzyme